MNTASQPQRCPACGQSNQCGLANPLTATAACWCFSVTIDPAAVSDVEMLQDMILIAINDAKGKADAASAEAMKQATGGLNLPPGMNLPF